MSRTLNLDVDNYVIVGTVSAQGTYSENLGQIISFAEDEHQRGLYWIQIQNKINLTDMNLVDNVVRFSSQELSSVSKLEGYSPSEGNMVYESFKRRIHEREAANNAAGIPDALAVPIPDEQALPDAVAGPSQVLNTAEETMPQPIESAVLPPFASVVEPTPIPRNPGVSHTRDSLTQSIARLVRNPQAPGTVPSGNLAPVEPEPEPELRRDLRPAVEDEPTFAIDAANFNLSLESGDMKTILKIAAKTPKEVFSIMDMAVDQNGHITFNYLDLNIQKELIDLKIASLATTSDMTFEVGQSYIFKYNDTTAEGIFLGDVVWIIPEDTNNIEIFTNDFLAINADIMKKCMVEKMAVDDSVDLISKVNVIKDGIARDMIEHIETLPATAVYKVRVLDDGSEITEEMLGKKWVDSITYYYFMEGELVWDILDIARFGTADSISIIAHDRNDTKVLTMLESEEALKSEEA